MANIKRESSFPCAASAAPGPSLPNQPPVKQEPSWYEEARPTAAESVFEGRDDGHLDGPQLPTHLSRLVSDTSNSADVLESAMRAGVRIIDRLIKPLQDHHGSQDAAAFIQSLKDLRSRAVPTRTVVGVVGNTGAGKSSVINALLDEER